ncbi:MAG: toll/interleukin-1 receptor domain-containing protein [bacterium]|nr:toll/interleukin-1 receptor domain-containing protein [bacterium]
MASIDDYFKIDREHNLTLYFDSSLSLGDGTVVPIKKIQNFAAGAIYFALRIPNVADPLDYCLRFLHKSVIDAIIDTFPKMTFTTGWGESSPSALRKYDPKDLVFCGRIYIYSEKDLKEEDVELLHSEGLKLGLYIEYYGPSWANKRSEMEKPLAFISHDSRDTEEIAMPLAIELSAKGVPVWFDEFSLQLGDSLRESIEKGIKETNYCILILSKNFLANNGWTKTEFDSVFTKELVTQKKIMLPIWHDISKEEVYEYCPSLVDRKAVKWSSGVESVAAVIERKIHGKRRN